MALRLKNSVRGIAHIYPHTKFERLSSGDTNIILILLLALWEADVQLIKEFTVKLPY